MTHIVSLWPAASCRRLAEAVNDDILSRTHDSGCYLSLTGPLERGKAPGAAFAELYRRNVAMTDANPTLHVFAVLPLYEAASETVLADIVAEASACIMPVSLCVTGMRGWMRHAVENAPESGAPDSADEETERIRRMSGIVSGATVACNFCVIDDFLANSAPVNFTHESLTRFLSEYFRIVIDHYPSIFNAAVYGQSEAVTGLGFASIEFPREKCTDFLMHKAFAAALEQAGVTAESVDLSAADADAAQALAGMPEYFSTFYSKHVERPQKLGADANEINSAISREIEREREDIAARISSIIYAKGASIPQREATIALILGKDNKYLKGMSPTLSHIFDDAFDEPLEIFLKASSERSGLHERTPLPVRGDYPELRYPPLGRNKDGTPLPDPRNKEAFNPLADIRRLRLRLIELSGWIRKNTKRLELLEETEKIRSEATTVLTEEGILVRPGGRLAASASESPLEEKYTPRGGKDMPASVDLREFFGPAVNQGELPSCSSFAAVALYEGLSNRLRRPGTPKLKLSEGYLFYHSNILRGKGHEGSNFLEQFTAMSTAGVCRAGLYEYSDTASEAEPGTEATSDASGHRLLQALEVPLQRTDRKFDDIEANHRILTAALAEGYPVGISLRIPEDFGAAKGAFINRPSEAVIASGKLYNHAMAIVGYDEEAKFYILRNSWGPEFGDKGYCYVSAGYIDDPELNNFCCIISRTSDSESAVGDNPLPVVAGIGGTEAEIELRSLRNTLEYAGLQLEWLTSEFRASYKYFINLIDKLSLPSVRRTLLGFARETAESRLLQLTTSEESLRTRLTANQRTMRNKFMSGAAAASAFLGFGSGQLASTLLDDTVHSLLLYAGGIVGWMMFFMIFYYGFLRKYLRRKLREEINSYAEEAGAVRRDIEKLEMRFFAAGAVLDMLKDVRGSLESTYLRLSSFVNNLRQWHGEYTARSVDFDSGDCPKFRVPSNSTALKAFFASKCMSIVDGFDFMALFRDYSARPESLHSLRQEMESRARRAVDAQFGAFRLTDHLAGVAAADFLEPVDLRETLLEMNRMAQPMLRSIGASTAQTVIVIAHHSDTPSWPTAIRPHFYQAPILLSAESTDKITLMTQTFISPENLI